VSLVVHSVFHICMLHVMSSLVLRNSYPECAEPNASRTAT
jgi:hypothetical protein